MLEIAIIGAGPAGLSAGINAIARGKTVRIFSSESNYLLRAEKVNNYLGLYDVDGRQMMEQFLSHARAMGVVPEKGKAANILPMGEYFLLNVDGEMVEAKTVILATGVSSAKEIPGERELLGRGVSYCATCDGFFFRNKPIVVVGGGDSAFEEADFLSRFGSSVTLIHRRSTFRASRIMVERAQRNPKIDFMLDAVVQKIRGDENGVQEVEVRNTATEKTSVIPANGVFMAIGHTPATAFLNGLVDVDSAGYITVDGASTRTSEPGVFAAGDCVDSVYRQAISAAGMGCRAALDAQAYLDSLK